MRKVCARDGDEKKKSFEEVRKSFRNFFFVRSGGVRLKGRNAFIYFWEESGKLPLHQIAS